MKRRLFVAVMTLVLGGCLLVRDFDEVSNGVRDAGGDGGPAPAVDAGACRLETLWNAGNGEPGKGPYLRGVATSTDTIYAVGGRFTSPTAAEPVGILLAAPKATPAAVTTLFANLDQPLAIATNVNGRPLVALQHGAAVLRIDDAGRTTEIFGGHGPVKDVTVDENGGPWAVYGPASATVVGPLDLQLSAPDASASRVVVQNGWVLVARGGGEQGVTLYKRGAALTRQCELAVGVSVVALAADTTRMAWASDKLYLAPLGDCATKRTLAPERALGVGVEASHVVARFDDDVRVWSTDGTLVCRSPLPSSQGIRSAMANATVVVEKDAAYVVSPVALYKLSWQ